ncbi:tRNA(Ile)-lysidine synthase [Candidatus Cyrtobacter comes]|uniref:tRNA(Ile)-lysidine synthase n=1 Tax=Candidatus Cyrtobacter comes TaxID=675776 RepID=A0ABU5L6V5_9RICK|nr:tRNA lysidine(34) synthetase TilS [Candidatus Cyrtobacter comes]MDZ5761853.1 tRNA(Ile)-lysidine synthase [Candidatus Cyrtobacter comes]
MIVFNPKFLNKLKEINNNFAIAVSGGADSMSLALRMKLYGFFPLCIVVDHGIRSESATEAVFVKNFLEGQGFKTIILKSEKFSKCENTSNLQHRARIERYNIITQYCIENKIGFVCTAHNKNDMAETVLLRIYRGSGIDGICGINEEHIWNGVIILRPLITIERVEIEDFLIANNWPWINDPSNKNEVFERVKFRNLISKFEDSKTLISRLCLLAKNASRARHFLEEQTEMYFKKICNISKYGYIIINKPTFLILHEELQLRLLAKVFGIISSFEYKPRLTNLENILSAIKDCAPFKRTIAGTICCSDQDEILIIREPNKIEQSITILNHTVCWDKRFEISFEGDINNLKISPLTPEVWGKIKNNHIIDNKEKKEMFRGLAAFSTPVLLYNDEPLYSLLLPIVTNFTNTKANTRCIVRYC